MATCLSRTSRRRGTDNNIGLEWFRTFLAAGDDVEALRFRFSARSATRFRWFYLLRICLCSFDGAKSQDHTSSSSTMGPEGDTHTCDTALKVWLVA